MKSILLATLAAVASAASLPVSPANKLMGRDNSAEAVYLVGVYVSVDRVVNTAMSLHAHADALGKVGHALGQTLVLALHDRGAAGQVAREHHVGRDEELVDAGVVGRPESAAHQPGAALDRVSGAAVGQGLGTGRGLALEKVG